MPDSLIGDYKTQDKNQSAPSEEVIDGVDVCLL
jgi:hypothetical protein